MFPHDYEVETSKVQALRHRADLLRAEIEELKSEFVGYEVAAGGQPGPFIAALEMILYHLSHVDISAEEVAEHRRKWL